MILPALEWICSTRVTRAPGRYYITIAFFGMLFGLSAMLQHLKITAPGEDTISHVYSAAPGVFISKLSFQFLITFG